MNHSDPDNISMNEPEFNNSAVQQKKASLLLKLLLIYALGVTLCRLLEPSMRYTGYIDLLARLPYYLTPFIALAWLRWKKCSQTGLFFTAGMSLLGIFIHAYAAFISTHWQMQCQLCRGGCRLAIEGSNTR